MNACVSFSMILFDLGQVSESSRAYDPDALSERHVWSMLTCFLWLPPRSSHVLFYRSTCLLHHFVSGCVVDVLMAISLFSAGFPQIRFVTTAPGRKFLSTIFFHLPSKVRHMIAERNNYPRGHEGGLMAALPRDFFQFRSPPAGFRNLGTMPGAEIEERQLPHGGGVSGPGSTADYVFGSGSGGRPIAVDPGWHSSSSEDAADGKVEKGGYDWSWTENKTTKTWTGAGRWEEDGRWEDAWATVGEYQAETPNDNKDWRKGHQRTGDASVPAPPTSDVLGVSIPKETSDEIFAAS